MTVPISYPGVYITEIPSGSRTIVGVATSITAFVGAASRGPADVPVTIFSFADFERTFGGLSRTSGLGYAVRDFYQNGGGEALIVRLVHTAVDKDGKVIENDQTNAATATLDVDGLLTWPRSARAPGATRSRWRSAIPARPTPEDVGLAQGVADDALFSLVVRDGEPNEGGLEETYFNVTVVDGPAPGHRSPRRLPAGAGHRERQRISPSHRARRRARGRPATTVTDGADRRRRRRPIWWRPTT